MFYRPYGLGQRAVREEAEVMVPRTGFVAGSTRWVEALQAALQDVGVQVHGCDDPERVADACVPFGSDSLDCYIQAPYEVMVGPRTDVERFRDLLTGSLLAQIQTAATLMPRLRADATVVLVADGRFPDSDVPDDPRARFDLLRVLGEAIRAAHAAGRVLVAGSRCSVAEIVATAVPGTTTSEAKPSRYAALSPDKTYADWKEQLLSLTSEHDWERAIRAAKSPVEYLGWIKPNGERAVVKRREKVVSPLRLEAAAPFWGSTGQSALPLARVLLRDALRPHPARAAGEELSIGRAELEADAAAETLSEAFVDEVLALLPAEEFTLSGKAIRSWARSHLKDLPSR